MVICYKKHTLLNYTENIDIEKMDKWLHYSSTMDI